MNEKEKIVKLEHYPSNSRSNKKDEDKRVEKIVSGNVRQRKKPLTKKLAETLLVDDTKTIWQYILHDVLIPSAKNTIYEMFTGGLGMSLFGETRSPRKSDRGRSYVSYGNYYRDRDEPRKRSPVNQARHSFDDIVLESRVDAEEVLGRLVDFIEDYDIATVADLHELVGITGSFTDNKWGWTNLATAKVIRVRDGYLIDLPKPELV